MDGKGKEGETENADYEKGERRKRMERESINKVDGDTGGKRKKEKKE